MAKAEIKKTEENVPKFTKEQICSSVKYSKHTDALSVLLKDNVSYSYAEIDEIIENFMKGKVK